MADRIIIANRLIDGLIVFLDAQNAWTLHVNEARVFADDAAIAPALEHSAREVAARVVIEPLPIDVKVEGGTIVPVRLRERIRAAGPTVVYGQEEFNKLGGGAARQAAE